MIEPSATAARIQYGALPWRRGLNGLEVLLITTRNTKRWIVPKGWPIAGRQPHDCAAFEALEEAGISGNIETASLGSFRYRKRLKSGEVIHCEVVIFAMEATEQKSAWPEKKFRRYQWCPVPDALHRVSFVGLRRLIQLLAARTDILLAGEEQESSEVATDRPQW